MASIRLGQKNSSEFKLSGYLNKAGMATYKSCLEPTLTFSWLQRPRFHARKRSLWTQIWSKSTGSMASNSTSSLITTLISESSFSWEPSTGIPTLKANSSRTINLFAWKIWKKTINTLRVKTQVTKEMKMLESIQKTTRRATTEISLKVTIENMRISKKLSQRKFACRLIRSSMTRARFLSIRHR